jgi:hypothetical protein
MKTSNRIYIKTWLALKPYEKQVVTDTYYLKLSNEVKQAILSCDESFMLSYYINDEETNLLACLLTSYFEDLISGTNLWNSFVRIHKRMYDKYLPFYSPEEYFEEEINKDDIQFLTWYFLNLLQNEKFIHPINDFIEYISEGIYEVFDKKWDEAPENTHLAKYYSLDENETNYYIARELIDNILFNSYLFYPDTAFRFHEKLKNLIKKREVDDNLAMYANDLKDNSIHTFHTQLLALSGKEWAAEVLGPKHPLSKSFQNLSPKINGLFLYKGQDSQVISMEHIASGKVFDITKESLELNKVPLDEDKINFIGTAKWMDKWWFSGVRTQFEYKQNVIDDEKKNISSLKQVDFLEDRMDDLNDVLMRQQKAFLKISNGKPFAFVMDDQVNQFIRDFHNLYNTLVASTSETNLELPDLSNSTSDIKVKDGQTPCIVFFNPKGGLEIAMNYCSAFPVEWNPYFNEEDCENDVIGLWSDKSISTEISKYCLENFRDKYQFLQRDGGENLVQNFDFMMRFWKAENYKTKPSVSLTNR